MYGWINNCLEDMIITKFGLEKWEKVKELAHCFIPTGDFILSVHYEDELTYRLIDAAAKVLGFPSGSDVWEIYGRHFIHFLEANHYSSTLRGQGNTLRDWILNINEPHRLLRARYPKCTLPEFWCENDDADVTGESILLHYYSPRKNGLKLTVIGMCKEAAKVYFNKELEMELIFSEDVEPENQQYWGQFAHHSVWRLKDVGKDSVREEKSDQHINGNGCSSVTSEQSYPGTAPPLSGTVLKTPRNGNYGSVEPVGDGSHHAMMMELAATCPFHRKKTTTIPAPSDATAATAAASTVSSVPGTAKVAPSHHSQPNQQPRHTHHHTHHHNHYHHHHHQQHQQSDVSGGEESFQSTNYSSTSLSRPVHYNLRRPNLSTASSVTTTNASSAPSHGKNGCPALHAPSDVGTEGLAGATTASLASSTNGAMMYPKKGYSLGPRCFQRIFPFHIILNQQMVIVQVGNKLHDFVEGNHHPTLVGMHISDVFSLSVTEKYPWSWSGLKKLQENAIVTLHSMRPEGLPLKLVGEVTILDDDVKYAQSLKRKFPADTTKRRHKKSNKKSKRSVAHAGGGSNDASLVTGSTSSRKKSTTTTKASKKVKKILSSDSLEPLNKRTKRSLSSMMMMTTTASPSMDVDEDRQQALELNPRAKTHHLPPRTNTASHPHPHPQPQAQQHSMGTSANDSDAVLPENNHHGEEDHEEAHEVEVDDEEEGEDDVVDDDDEEEEEGELEYFDENEEYEEEEEEKEEEVVAALLVNPIVSDLSNLLALGFNLTDLPRHSFQRDILQMEEHLKTELNNTVKMTQLSKRLEHARRKSNEALTMKRIFVRYVSHEIRTPLNVALLGLKYLEEEVLGNAAAASAMASAIVVANHRTAASAAAGSLLPGPDVIVPIVPESSERSLCAMEVDSPPLIPTSKTTATAASSVVVAGTNHGHGQGHDHVVMAKRVETEITLVGNDGSIDRQPTTTTTTATTSTTSMSSGAIGNGGNHLSSIVNDATNVSLISDVVADVKDSCILAVEILNDLLLYEKIDDGVFALHTSSLCMTHFLREAEKLFRMQAKGAGVRLILTGNVLSFNQLHHVMQSTGTGTVMSVAVNGANCKVMSGSVGHATSSTVPLLDDAMSKASLPSGEPMFVPPPAKRSRRDADVETSVAAPHLHHHHHHHHHHHPQHPQHPSNRQHATAGLDGVNVNVNVGADDEEELVQVQADRAKLHQVLRNLFTNAVKFTPQHGLVALSCDLKYYHVPSDDVDFDNATSDYASNYNSTSQSAAYHHYHHHHPSDASQNHLPQANKGDSGFYYYKFDEEAQPHHLHQHQHLQQQQQHQQQQQQQQLQPQNIPVHANSFCYHPAMNATHHPSSACDDDVRLMLQRMQNLKEEDITFDGTLQFEQPTDEFDAHLNSSSGSGGCHHAAAAATSNHLLDVSHLSQPMHSGAVASAASVDGSAADYLDSMSSYIDTHIYQKAARNNHGHGHDHDNTNDNGDNGNGDRRRMYPYVRISVSDSGCGISKRDQLSLFHEFIQVKADKLQNGQGSGLGLWIAANIVKMHGGRIGVVSEGEGHGATFVMDLPCCVRPSPPPPPPPAASLSSSSSIPSTTDAAHAPDTREWEMAGAHAPTTTTHVSDHPHPHASIDTRVGMAEAAAPDGGSDDGSDNNSSSASGRPTTQADESNNNHIHSHNNNTTNTKKSKDLRSGAGVVLLPSAADGGGVGGVGGGNDGAMDVVVAPSTAVITTTKINKSDASTTGGDSTYWPSYNSVRLTHPADSTVIANASTATATATATAASDAGKDPASSSSSPSSTVNCASSDASSGGPFITMVPRMVLPSTTHESRLLLVDDAPSNRKMVKRILQSSFGQIDEAENGMQAVCMVEAAMMAGAPYHLVMMDFMMPVMNGLEATKCIKKWVREHSAGRNSILVVGVTGNGLEEDIQAFREAGADDVLLKPLNLAHFLNIFKRYYRLP